jgi:hypothetical protein
VGGVGKVTKTRTELDPRFKNEHVVLQPWIPRCIASKAKPLVLGAMGPKVPSCHLAPKFVKSAPVAVSRVLQGVVNEAVPPGASRGISLQVVFPVLYLLSNSSDCKRQLSRRHLLADSGIDQMGR